MRQLLVIGLLLVLLIGVQSPSAEASPSNSHAWSPEPGIVCRGFLMFHHYGPTTDLVVVLVTILSPTTGTEIFATYPFPPGPNGGFGVVGEIYPPGYYILGVEYNFLGEHDATLFWRTCSAG